MSRASRIIGILVGTLVFLTLGLVYPTIARGDAWLGAIWTVPFLSWMPREARLPTLLVVIVLAGALVLWRMTIAADARTPRLRLATIAPLVTGPRGFRTKLRDMPGMVRVAALALAMLAIGRPQNVLRGENTDEKGIDIVLVLDLSGSMRALMDADSAPARQQGGQITRLTRLDTAKEVILDFVARRHNDRIGVVVFGRAAYILSPPTLDKSLLAALVSKMDLGLIDGNGDDVDVQDGTDIFGQPRFVREHFPVNPELLRRMAQTTGGDSFVANDKKGLEQSMHQILDKLEKTRFESQVATMEDLFPFLLLPAVALLALEALIRVLIVRRFP